ncbi:MAG TPA: molybdopterin cofactor-binding domain-containing protein, partial [Steroidobacteraceae bacterium]|nr:molybdopterin cofactor-binding domain-containing protein [Steroidobacteraceae bacterium]
MDMSTAENSLSLKTSRRELLKAGGALTIAVWLPAGHAAAHAKANAANTLEPNAFVRIAPDNTVTVIAKHVEMGQGAYSGLATIVAEELDADWHQVRVEGAPADAKRYNNLSWGPFQGTGGSTAIANSFDQLRNAGATARAMLVSAAAKRWNVPAGEIVIESGVVKHPGSNHSASFGELASDAAQLPIPTQVKLKDPSQYQLIGKPIQRVDAREKSTGTATFTQDIKLPGMLTAVVAHPPRFGGKVKRFDPTAARAIKGVVAVVPFETAVRSGVAVVAKDFWSAHKGRDALKIEWDDSNAFHGSTEELWAQYRALA